MPIWRKNSSNVAFGAKKPKCRWAGPLGEVTNRNFAKQKQIVKFSSVRHTICSVHRGTLGPILGHLQVLEMCLVESLSCLLSNPTRIFKFGVHLPLQIFILPKLLHVCQKVAERPFLGFFDLLETHNFPKFLVRTPVIMIFHAKSKNASHLWFGAPNPKHRASGEAHREKKPMLWPKICHVNKIAPNFLKFGL